MSLYDQRLLLVAAAFLIAYGNGLPTNPFNYSQAGILDSHNKGSTEKNPFTVAKFDFSNKTSNTTRDVLPYKLNFTPKINKRYPRCTSTYCETIDDYPSEYLLSIMPEKINEYKEILGVDKVKSPSNLSLLKVDEKQEFTFCAAFEQIVYPKTAKNKDNKWLYIVNQNPYLQGVLIEKCEGNNETGNLPCLFKQWFPMGLKTSCKQKYIYRKLVALDEQGKTITDSFQLPSCCSCEVKSKNVHQKFNTTPKTPKSTTLTEKSETSTAEPK